MSASLSAFVLACELTPWGEPAWQFNPLRATWGFVEAEALDAKHDEAGRLTHEACWVVRDRRNGGAGPITHNGIRSPSELDSLLNHLARGGR